MTSREPAEQIWPAFSKIGADDIVERKLDVGIGQHDVRRLAAELKRHRGDVTGRRLHDADAGDGRAGEGDVANIRMRDKRRADASARAGHDIDRRHAAARPRRSSSASISAVIGVCSAGFTTAVQPAASAGATLRAAVESG